MELTIKKEVSQVVNIPDNSFWEDGMGNACALIGGHTFYKVLSGSKTLIVVGGATLESTQKDIIECHEQWVPSTEEEFMSIYKDARFKTDLKPHLISKEMDCAV